MPIIVNRDKCTACGQCIDSCPFAAIVMKEDKAFVTEDCQYCMGCLSACPEGAIYEMADEGGFLQQVDISDYKDIWVFAEQREGKVATVALELLGAGRRLADGRGAELSAVLFGASQAEGNELIRWGADRVYLADDPLFRDFNDEPYAQLMTRLVRQHKPEIILAGATPIGRSFMPRVAARLKTGLTADCTALEIDKETGDFLQIRPAFGGNIMATILCPHHRPQIATVRPRVMKKAEYDEARTGEIVNVSAANLSCRTKVIETVKEASECMINLQEAEIIVSGGRGLGNPKGFELLEELAQLIGGAVGSSRAAVDEGWVPYRHQVGQTGKTVCPKIYIACGISGAVQHLVGMQSSDVIIAINKNPDAPIFNVATFGVVGDLYEVLPLMIKRIREVKG